MKKHFMKKYLIATSMLAAAGFAGTSHAVDGVFEISQACVEFGCVPGDSAFFPVTISESGSYRLTSNIIVSSPIVTIIEVNADNVSIDLNGFSLLGPASGSTGVGVGINAGSSRFTSISNGNISGMGGRGVVVGSNSYLEDLVVTQNGSIGIDASGSFGSLFRRLVVWGNSVGVDNSGGLLNINYIMDSSVTSNPGGGVTGGFCSNVFMLANGPNSCTAIAPNRCDVASQCD